MVFQIATMDFHSTVATVFVLMMETTQDPSGIYSTSQRE
jgi:hypothetical protein